jgi:hypothetical protein
LIVDVCNGNIEEFDGLMADGRRTKREQEEGRSARGKRGARSESVEEKAEIA